MLVPSGCSRPCRGWKGVGHAQAGEGGGDGGWREEKDKEVGEKDGGNVEERKLSFNSNAESECAKVGEGRGDKERGAAKENDHSARLAHNVPADFLTKRPIAAIR